MARRAEKKRLADPVIPLYVNLKGFHPQTRPVGGEAVGKFILQSLTKAHDPEVDEFLRKEFRRGMVEGWWLLLLDSFDEIPDVLSATENDGTVTEYAVAIRQFVSGMRRSQAIIASREFHAPDVLPVPRFKIIELTAKRQADLVRRSGLTASQQDIVQVGLAEPQLQADAKNPMFLSLVCEYVRSRRAFPPSSHETYDHYVERRLSRDADRMRQRHEVEYGKVREVTEKIAFVMTATDGFGLSAPRDELRSALKANGVSGPEFDAVLAALGDTKLGHVADGLDGSGVPRFTFVHRRFQEYFATCTVLQESGQVSEHELLTNGRWRETAVTLLKLQPPEAAAPLLAEAARLLRPMVRAGTRKGRAPRNTGGFAWPRGGRHLLQLLDAGLGHAPGAIGIDIRQAVGRLLRAAWENGQRHDRKWATSVALIADRETTIWLVEEAFKSGSVYLGGEAYGVVSRMADPPESLYQGIRQILVDWAAAGRLRRERVTLEVQIGRLPDPDPLLRVLRLLTAAQVIDLVLAAAIVAAVSAWHPVFLAVYAIILSVAILCLSRYAEKLRSDGQAREITTWLWASFAAACVPIGLMACRFAFGNISNIHLWSPPDFLAAIVLYFCAWVFSVPYASINGRGMRIYEWPILPISSLVDLSISFITKSFFRDDKWQSLSMAQRVVTLLLFLPVFLVGCAILLALVLAPLLIACYLVLEIWIHLLRMRWEHMPSRIRLDFIVYWLSALIAILVIAGGFEVLREWKGQRSTVRVMRDRGAEVNANDLLNALSQIKMAHRAEAVIRLAYNGDLVNSPDLSQVLFDLTRIKPGKSLGEQQVGPEVEQWLDTRQTRQITMVHNAAERLHDLIAQAVERAELSRHEKNPGP
jgi:hypothetical protein